MLITVDVAMAQRLPKSSSVELVDVVRNKLALHPADLCLEGDSAHNEVACLTIHRTSRALQKWV